MNLRRTIPASTAGRYAFAAGFMHFLLGFGLQIFTRPEWLNPSFGIDGLVGIGITYFVFGLGLVATGAFPVFAWTSERMITPALTTSGWFLWGVSGTWLHRHRFPMGASTGIGWMEFIPYPDYMLKVPLLGIALLVVTEFEMIFKIGVSIFDQIGTALGKYVKRS